MQRNVLLIGNGGREHALAWRLWQSAHIGRLYIAPGNAGTRELGVNVPIDPCGVTDLLAFAKEHRIDLTVVGPDNPLAAGIVDAFRNAGIAIFGPTRAAARIESSKVFAKLLMQQSGIPTAAFCASYNYGEARALARKMGAPIVVKADGLAKGKAVIVCRTIKQADDALASMMITRDFGNAGGGVVLEKLLIGEELSAHALSDGNKHACFPLSRDYKTIAADSTKNTGGMGAFAPVPSVHARIAHQCCTQVVAPALRVLAMQHAPFIGTLYPGIMLAQDGLNVLEYNARFGDPETQVYMRLLKSDLLNVLDACVHGTLARIPLRWINAYAVCVVIASGGYPDAYETGFFIDGIHEANRITGVRVFHAGTAYDGAVITDGGRVLNVTAVGSTLETARARAYRAVALIRFDRMYCRPDIADLSLHSLPVPA